jgi:hypothetical protein
MTRNPASRLALAISATAACLALSGCASAARDSCPDPVPNPSPVTLTLKGGKIVLSPNPVCVVAGGIVRFILNPDTRPEPKIDLKLELKIDLPVMPPVVCRENYCDVGPMPKPAPDPNKSQDVSYTGKVTIGGVVISFDPIIRILP